MLALRQRICWLIAAAMLAAVVGCAHTKARREDRCPVPKIDGGVTCVCGPPHGDLAVPEFVRTSATMEAEPAPITLVECVLVAVEQHEAIRQVFCICPASDGQFEHEQCHDDWPLSLVLVPKVSLSAKEYLAAVRQLEELILRVERAYCELHRSQVELSIYDDLLKEAEGRAATLAKPEAEPLLTVQQRGQLDLQMATLREQRHTALAGTTGKLGLMGAELALREAIGLPPEDGRHLVVAPMPHDAVTDGLPVEWSREVYDALWHRAELRLARGEAYDAEWKSERPEKRTRHDKKQHLDPQQEICEGRREFFQKAIALRTLERQTLFELVRAYRQRAAAEALLTQRHVRQEAAERILAARHEEFERNQITWDAWLAALRDVNEARSAVEDATIERHLAGVAYRRAQGTLGPSYGVLMLATAERKPKDTDKRKQAKIEACIQRTMETMKVELGPSWPVETINREMVEEVPPSPNRPSHTLPDPSDIPPPPPE